MNNKKLGETWKVQLNMEPIVAIVILNWNGWRDTLECLKSIRDISYYNFITILVDNCSIDESISKILEFIWDSSMSDLKIDQISITEPFVLKVNDKFIVIRNERNFGYAEGNNIGIKYALNHFNPKYILLINNDVIVEKHFLNKLIDVAEDDSQIGILGPTVYDFTISKKVIHTGGHVNFALGICRGNSTVGKSRMDPLKIDEVDYIEGSCILIRNSVINMIGFLDTSFFAYWEDVDFCLRAKKRGYVVVHVMDSKIWHKGSNTSKKISGFKEYYTTRNRFIIMRKHATVVQSCIFIIFFLCCNLFYRSLLLLLLSKNIFILFCYFKGIWSGIREMFGYKI